MAFSCRRDSLNEIVFLLRLVSDVKASVELANGRGTKTSSLD